LSERRLRAELGLALLLEVADEILALDPQLLSHLGNGLLRHLDYPSSPSVRRRAVLARRMIPTHAAIAGTACATGIDRSIRVADGDTRRGRTAARGDPTRGVPRRG